jgi:iron complex transport system substrate-binding protein
LRVLVGEAGHRRPWRRLDVVIRNGGVQHMRTNFAPLSAFGLVVLLLLTGCGSSSSGAATTEKPLITRDANGTTIAIPAKAPQRIVSLGATDSEILGALGLDARVVGVDAFTDYPASLASKTKVTDSSAKANIEQIIALHPDLVLSFGGETADTDRQLMQNNLTVVDLPAGGVDESLTEIRLVGQLTHAESAANSLVSGMQQRINTVTQKVANAPKVTVYMEVGFTPPPPFAYGGGSFGDDLIKAAGGTNIFASDTANGGFPQVSEEEIIKDSPQVIILTEDPQYGGDPAQVAKRPGWSQIAAVQNHRVYAINPDLAERPGPRMVDALEQLAKDLHPELFA